jgi:hypothetical protein
MFILTFTECRQNIFCDATGLGACQSRGGGTVPLAGVLETGDADRCWQ